MCHDPPTPELYTLSLHDALPICELGETVVGGMVEPGARDVVVPVRKKAWEAAFGGEEAARPHVRARLTGWPSRADRKSTRLNSSHRCISYAVFCLKKKKI